MLSLKAKLQFSLTHKRNDIKNEEVLHDYEIIVDNFTVSLRKEKEI